MSSWMVSYRPMNSYGVCSVSQRSECSRQWAFIVLEFCWTTHRTKWPKETLLFRFRPKTPRTRSCTSRACLSLTFGRAILLR